MGLAFRAVLIALLVIIAPQVAQAQIFGPPGADPFGPGGNAEEEREDKGGFRVSTKHLEEFNATPKQVQAARELFRKQLTRKLGNTKFDELEWSPIYEFRDSIFVVSMRYKYIEQVSEFQQSDDGFGGRQVVVSRPTVAEMALLVQGELGHWKQGPLLMYPDSFNDSFEQYRVALLSKEEASKEVTGKRIDAVRPVAPMPVAEEPKPDEQEQKTIVLRVRTWSSQDGQFSVQAALVDIAETHITLLTVDMRMLKIETSRIDAESQRFVEQEKKLRLLRKG